MAPKYNESNERPSAPGDNASMPLDTAARGAQFERVVGKSNVSSDGTQTTTRPVDTPERNTTGNGMNA